MSKIIEMLISDKILIFRNPDYECKCGSVISKKAIRQHIITKKHLNFIGKDEKNCDICCDSKNYFYKCNTCKNTHCWDCHAEMIRCPFCRKSFLYKQEERFFKNLRDRVFQYDCERDIDKKILLFFKMCTYITDNRGILNRPHHADLKRQYMQAMLDAHDRGFKSGMYFFNLLNN